MRCMWTDEISSLHSFWLFLPPMMRVSSNRSQEGTETAKSRAVGRMRRVQKNVRQKSLLTPHQRRGKPISMSASKWWRISKSKVTKRYNRNSSSFDIGSFNSAREKIEQTIATNTCLRTTVHLFIKLCGRWNVLCRVEKLCPIHSGYGHMSGPSTTINHTTSVSRCIALPKKNKILLTICQTVYRSLPHYD